MTNAQAGRNVFGRMEDLPGPIGGLSRQYPLAWMPAAFFLVLIITLRFLPDIGVPPSYNALLPWTNFLLTTCTSLLVAALMVRSFLTGASTAALWMGSGLLILGLASLLAGLKIQGGRADAAVATYNIAVCLSGLCQVLGAARAFYPSVGRPVRRVYAMALTALGLSCAVLAGVSVASLSGWLPPFWSAGSTPARDVVLGLAVGEFLLAAAMLGMLYRMVRRPFLFWYSLGLLLLGFGLGGILLLRDLNSLLAWTGRATQYAGGLYMLWAVLTLRRSGRWEVPLERELQEAVERVRLLARFPEENPGPVLRFRDDGTLLYANPAARACTEWGLALGRPGPAALLRLVEQALARGQATEAEIACGQSVLLATASPAAQEHYVNVFARDVTDRKRAEGALAEHAAQLAEINRELESFSYSVSHDLRAPLRAIDGYSRMILGKHAGDLNEDAHNKFNAIRDNTRMMGQLIDDLLAFSRLGKAPLSLAKLDMKNLIEEIWQEFLAGAGPDRRLELKIAALPLCMGDRGLVRQVLVNLLANAVKFTKMRAEARIEAGGDVRGSECIYYIRDNGVGFDMKDHDRMFGVFQRLHSADEFEGTGVGLALVQRIVNRHNGKVWAEGQADKGATFYFTLPAYQE